MAEVNLTPEPGNEPGKGDPNVKPAAVIRKSRAEAADPTVTMTFEGDPWSGTLTIGVEDFEVKDGVVEVPSSMYAAAHQAGFR